MTLYGVVKPGDCFKVGARYEISCRLAYKFEAHNPKKLTWEIS